MNKLRLTIPFLLTMFICATQVNASEKEASIEQLFVAMGIDKQLNGGFEAMLPMVDQISAKMNLNAQDKEELKNIYRDWFNNDIDRTLIKNKMLKLYSDRFSNEEIKEVIAFYKTPIGQKFLNASPELMKLGAQIGMQEGQAKQALLLKRLEPFLNKHKPK